MRVSSLVSLVLAACWGVSGTVGATTLTVAQLAAHNHQLPTYQNPGQGNCVEDADTSQAFRSSFTYQTGSSQPHTHSLTASSAAANNLPPYYAAAFIMRIA